MNPSSEWLAGVREKVQRSEKHIAEVKTEIDRFRGANPYSLMVDVEAQPAKPTVHVLKADPVPPIISIASGDAIHNLRSALDHIACVLVLANGNPITERTGFPIMDYPPSSAEEKRSCRRKVQGMRQEAIDAIRSVNPYKAGDVTLWRLHSLDIIDKHKMLVAAFGSITAVNGILPLNPDRDSNGWAGIPGSPVILKKGQQFSIELPDLEVDKNTEFFAEIVFNEPGVVEGYPVLLALRHFHDRVLRIIGQLSVYLK